MSSIDDDDQKLVNKAVALLLKAPMLTIPQSMHRKIYHGAKNLIGFFCQILQIFLISLSISTILLPPSSFTFLFFLRSLI